VSESNAIESTEAMESMGSVETKVGGQPHGRKDIINV